MVPESGTDCCWKMSSVGEDRSWTTAEVFVGQSRQAAHDLLVDRYLAVCDGSGPRLVTIAAPRGEGKTRVVQQFYATLARNYQGQSAYWPATMLAPGEGVLSRHGHVYPMNPDVPADAPLPWLWWGLYCSLDSAARPERAAENALPQFKTHTESLRRQIERRRKNREIGFKALGVLLSMFQVPYVDLAKDSLDFLKVSAERGQMAVADRRARRMRRAAGGWGTRDTEAYGVEAAARELARTFAQVCGQDLPFIVVIDNAHAADRGTIALLDGLMRSRIPALIVATAWPDQLDRQRAEEEATPTQERVSYGGWLTAISGVFPKRVDVRTLPALAEDDLAAIVNAVAPQTDGNTTASLIDHAGRNPLILNLLLEIPTVWASLAEGALHLDRAEIEQLPDAFKSLVRDSWRRELPPEAQKFLALSTLQGSRFVAELTLAMIALGEAEAQSAQHAARRWAQYEPTAGEYVFTEQIQHEVAEEERAELFSPSDLDIAAANGKAWVLKSFQGDELSGVRLSARRTALRFAVDQLIEQGAEDPRLGSNVARKLSNLDFHVGNYGDCARHAEVARGWLSAALCSADREPASDLEFLDLSISLAHELRWADRHEDAVATADRAACDTETAAGRASDLHIQALHALALAHRAAGEHLRAYEVASEGWEIAKASPSVTAETREWIACDVADGLDDLARTREAVAAWKELIDLAERSSSRRLLEYRARWLGARGNAGEDVTAELAELQAQAESEPGLPPDILDAVRGALVSDAFRRGDLERARMLLAEEPDNSMRALKGAMEPIFWGLQLGDMAALRDGFGLLVEEAERDSGVDDPNVLYLKVGRALLLPIVGSDSPDLREALDDVQRTVGIAERSFGRAHPQTVSAIVAAAALSAATDDQDGAGVALTEALTRCREMAPGVKLTEEIAAVAAYRLVAAAEPALLERVAEILRLALPVDATNGVSMGEMTYALANAHLALRLPGGDLETVLDTLSAVAEHLNPALLNVFVLALRDLASVALTTDRVDVAERVAGLADAHANPDNSLQELCVAYMRGKICQVHGDYAGARNRYTWALERLDPTLSTHEAHAPFLAALATAECHLGQFDAAVSHWRDACEAFGQLLPHSEMIRLQESVGMTTKAGTHSLGQASLGCLLLRSLVLHSHCELPDLRKDARSSLALAAARLARVGPALGQADELTSDLAGLLELDEVTAVERAVICAVLAGLPFEADRARAVLNAAQSELAAAEAGTDLAIAIGLLHAARFALALGEPLLARSLCEQGLRWTDHEASPRMAGLLWDEIGRTYNEEEAAAARSAYATAVRFMAAIQLPRDRVETLLHLAAALARLGDRIESRRALDEAVGVLAAAIMNEGADAQAVLEAINTAHHAGHSAEALGQLQVARAAYTLALGRLDHGSSPGLAGELAADIGDIYRIEGSDKDAAPAYRDAASATALSAYRDAASLLARADDPLRLADVRVRLAEQSLRCKTRSAELQQAEREALDALTQARSARAPGSAADVRKLVVRLRQVADQCEDEQTRDALAEFGEEP